MKYIIAGVLILMCTACTKDADVTPSSMPEIDSLWNFDDPAGSEKKFREVVDLVHEGGQTEYFAELRTQIARAQGLQQKYDEAFATLDQVDAVVTPAMATVQVRSLLERGRVWNSMGQRDTAVPIFESAFRRAQEAGLEYYAVDAAHMLGIAAKGAESLRWNEEAMRLAESAEDPRALRWLGPLYNNTAWTYFDMGNYSEALQLFERDMEYRKSNGTNAELGIARWSRAKMLRHLGNVEESLRLQLELLNDPDRQGNDSEGYTREEIAECLLLLGRADESKAYFAQAWELLREDPWLRQDEPQRLERLRRLGGIP